MRVAPGAFRLTLLLAIASASSCSSCRREPAIDDAVYREAVSAFHTGLAALETSQDALALEKLTRVTKIVPTEPAAWADLGLLYLRHQELDLAAEQLTRAASLAPNNAAILRLQGLTASRRGDLEEAIGLWKKALARDAGDVRSAFSLAEEIERRGGANDEAEAERVLGALLGQTDNIAVRIEYARLVAKRGDGALLRQLVAPLQTLSAAWPAEAREQLQTLVAAAEKDPRSAALQAVFLKNVLLPVPAYRTALAIVSTSQAAVGEPLDHFLTLKNPQPTPAPADTSLTFTLTADTAAATGAIWSGVISLDGEGPPVVATAAPGGLRIGGETIATPLLGPGARVLAADINYDFRTDLIVAGLKGLALFSQTGAGTFRNVTPAARIPAAIQSAPVAGLWAADVDLDGDLDLVVAPVDGALVVLRNNTDGTFSPQTPFGNVARVRGFVWADCDEEPAPDAAILDERGAVRLFRNLRGGAFKEQALGGANGGIAAIAAADIGHGPAFDVLLLNTAGAISRIVADTWTTVPVTSLERAPDAFASGNARLIVADVDNNGAGDLVVAGAARTSVLLSTDDARFVQAGEPLSFAVTDAADLDADGRIDLVGIDAAHRAVRAATRGSMAYHWQVLRPRAATARGDQRINSFGLGGAVEIRTGLHTQKQVIQSPLVHFGTGTATATDVVRITWPNGVLQSDFDQQADRAIAADQRLKGSCPWLFAWNGRAMAFVTDVIWRSPLGLRINAQATADVLMTEDRVKIPGTALVPRNGAYDLRITAELWETHFFDLVSLMVVDHPAGTEAFIDERFAIPSPSLDPVATGPVQAFGSARDDQQRDVSATIRARDSQHLDFAGRGDYQGITRDHFVELELPADAPRTGPLYLVAQGWIHPTDSSVNVAISQGRHAAPRGLSLEVADGAGRFQAARTNLGFPAGKDKTVLIDLAGVFPAGAPRRLRLSTNLEIFWDRLGWAVGRPDVPLAPRRLALSSADLGYRGYSVTGQRDPSSPERPRYELSGTAPRWFDLEGYYTRYGDVRDLLTGIDDRYVIMNAGDELRLRFPDAGAPAAGMVRDFIVVGDGWVKDGDYNTKFSRTVLPLPAHDTPRYDRPPGQLRDDPVYRRHPQDFLNYHTRYVGPDNARDALRRAAARRQ